MTLAPDTRQTKASTPPQTPAREEARLPIERYFTKPEVDPYDEIEWELRTASIEGADGKPVFEQKDVRVPRHLVAERDERRRLQVLPGRAQAVRRGLGPHRHA